jgi:hypothetical protein
VANAISVSAAGKLVADSSRSLSGLGVLGPCWMPVATLIGTLHQTYRLRDQLKSCRCARGTPFARKSLNEGQREQGTDSFAVLAMYSVFARPTEGPPLHLFHIYQA